MPGTTEIKGIVNGVDVDALRETLAAIGDTPSMANFRFRARNRWIQGGHNRTTVQNFYGANREDTSRARPFQMDADEPAILLGQDAGANPVEHLLHALASCLTTALVYHAAARGIQVEEVESELEGDIDLHGFLGLSNSVRKGYENIRVRFRVKSDAPAWKLEECAKFSPVLDSITNAVPVSLRVETA